VSTRKGGMKCCGSKGKLLNFSLFLFLSHSRRSRLVFFMYLKVIFRTAFCYCLVAVFDTACAVNFTLGY
jgi:hypothetical protein